MPLAAAPRDALRGLDNVQRVEARLAGTTRWRPDDDERKENLAIQGVANFQDEQALDRVHVARGALPRRGEILFEKGARQKYGVAVGQQVKLVGVDGEQTYTVSGLLPGHVYYFAVTAYDTSGNESSFSNEVSK